MSNRALLTTFSILWAAFQAAAAPPTTSPTFSRDVAPILYRHCAACHRPGEVGPFSLLTYNDARSWAATIQEAVVQRRMPPWHADPKYGRFSNERRLSDAEIRTLEDWVNQGTPEGNPKDLPVPPQFTAGWMMGQPDVEITIPQPMSIPATGTVKYQYLTVPTGFTKDMWVEAAEIRPGNRSIMHHVVVFVLPPGWKDGMAVTVGDFCRQNFFLPDDRQASLDRKRTGEKPMDFGIHLVTWAPGFWQQPWPTGSAKLIPAGSRLLFELHYTPKGKAEVDRETKVGLRFAREPVSSEIHTVLVANRQIIIPPGSANHEASACFTVTREATLVDLMPHMHVRGKGFSSRVVFPDGKTETLLSVPRYDFNWQTDYKLTEPLRLPPGTRIDCIATFDNSENNPNNPNPKAEVRWGDQTWEEMLIGFISLRVDRASQQKASK